MSLQGKSKFLTEKQIKIKIQNCHIFDKDLKNTDLFIYYRKFVKNHIMPELSVSKEKCLTIIKSVLSVLAKNFLNYLEKEWNQFFFFHTIIQLLGFLNKSSSHIFQIILAQIEDIYQCMSKNPKSKKKDSSLLSRSLNKLKRTFSLQSFEIPNKNQAKSVQQKYDKSSFTLQVLTQYCMYLKKIAAQYLILNHYQIAIQNKNYYQKIQEQPQQFKNFVWKLFNIIKIPGKITKVISKIERYFPQLNKYNYSTINFLTQDYETFYNPIVDFINVKKRQIISTYQNNFQKSKHQNKFAYREQLLAYSRSDAYIQVNAMISELANVNQIVVYLYGGSLHYMYIVKTERQRKYTSINNQKFDKLYKIFEIVQQQKRKIQQSNLIKQTSQLNKSFGLNSFSSKQNQKMKAVNYKSSRLSSHMQCSKIVSKIQVRQTKASQRSQAFNSFRDNN